MSFSQSFSFFFSSSSSVDRRRCVVCWAPSLAERRWCRVLYSHVRGDGGLYGFVFFPLFFLFFFSSFFARRRYVVCWPPSLAERRYGRVLYNRVLSVLVHCMSLIKKILNFAHEIFGVSHLRLTLRTVRMRVPPDDSTFLCLAVLTKRLCATCCCCCQNLLTLSKTEWSHPPSLVWCARACTAAAVRREGLYRVVPGAPSPPSSSSSSSYISLRHLHTLSAIAEHDQRNGKLLVQPLVPCWSKE